MIKIICLEFPIYLILFFYSLELNAKNVAAPSVNCEIRSSAWCITDGAYSIQRELATDSIHDRIWMVGNYFKPGYRLIIFEPNGCRLGYANQVKLESIELNYA